MSNLIQAVKGTRDFYPEDMALRTWLYTQIRQVSEAFGYQEYEGPLLESFELYAAKSGEELVNKQSFVFPDRGGNLVTLRPELTPTLARLVAQRQRQLIFPVRWWSFGPMWRYEQPQRGRTREFFQWNIDLLGLDIPEADAELVATGAAFLQRVGLKPQQVQILVNNRRLMDRSLGELGIPPPTRPNVFRLIDRRERFNSAAWEKMAAQEIGLDAEQLAGLVNLLEDEELWRSSEELVRFFEALEAMGAADYVSFKPNIIRGLDYYTGTVFECFDTGGKFRAIFAGGRYDNLVADVGGDPIPGVGFAMGDKVIALVLEQYGLLPDTRQTSQADILVTAFDQDLLPQSLGLAAEIRAAGLRAIAYLQPDKLGKQFRFADRVQAQLALVLGPEEIAQNQVTVKDLAKRDQATIPRAELISFLFQLLADKNNPPQD